MLKVCIFFIFLYTGIKNCTWCISAFIHFYHSTDNISRHYYWNYHYRMSSHPCWIREKVHLVLTANVLTRTVRHEEMISFLVHMSEVFSVCLMWFYLIWIQFWCSKQIPISAPHSLVILVIHCNYCSSEKHCHVCSQFFSLIQIRPTLG